MDLKWRQLNRELYNNYCYYGEYVDRSFITLSISYNFKYFYHYEIKVTIDDKVYPIDINIYISSGNNTTVDLPKPLELKHNGMNYCFSFCP